MKTFYLLIFLVCLLSSCKQKQQNYIFLEGIAQGGTFHITYQPNPDTLNSKEIYGVLDAINRSLSVYDSNSIISRINKNDSTVEIDRYFSEIYRESYKIYQITDGYFDITVAPLVRYWGFLPKDNIESSSTNMDSLLRLVGMDKVHLIGQRIIKDDPRIQLDVNGIAQGYTVDKLSMLLESKNITNYMVEVGGEVKVKGNNPSGEKWKVGVDKPIENSNELNRELQAILHITDTSLATSGSYRKFIEKDGIKFSHTINPKTGLPTYHRLLSVTILHPSCTFADAMATAIMVMGLEKGMKYIKENRLSALLIYSDEQGNLKTWATSDVEKQLKILQ